MSAEDGEHRVASDDVIETAIETADDENESRRSRMKSYICSLHFVELVLCFGFGVVGAFVPGAIWLPSDRNGVPYQTAQVSDNGADATSSVLFDLTFNRERVDETVPMELAGLLTAVLPLVLQSMLSMWFEAREKKELAKRRWEAMEGRGVNSEESSHSLPDPSVAQGEPSVVQGKGETRDGEIVGSVLHRTLCTYFVAGGMTLLFTETIKRYVGYMRPVFYDMCDPNVDAFYQDPSTTTLKCQSDGHPEMDYYQSFPSGHSSVAFAGMTLLSSYFSRIFGRTDGGREKIRRIPVLLPRWPRLRRLLRIVSVMLSMALALFIAASRVADNYHHPADVVGGAVLGASCSLFANELWL